MALIGRLAKVFAGMFALVLGATTVTSCDDSTDPDSGERIAIMSWNLCAPASRLCPYGGQIKTKTNAVVRNVVRNRASVVLLQEACEKVAPKLERALEHREQAFLEADRRPWTVRFVPQYEPASPRLVPERCRDWPNAVRPIDPEAPRGQHGLIIAIRGETRSKRYEVLPSPPEMRHRVASCVRQEQPVKLAVCTTQLSQDGEDPSGEFRTMQVNRLAELARKAERAGYHTVVGGDLNTAPTARRDRTGLPGSGLPATSQVGTDRGPILGGLYDSSTECSGQPSDGIDDVTVDENKFDYLFVGGGLELTGCDVTRTDYSDHDLLVATVSVERSGEPS